MNTNIHHKFSSHLCAKCGGPAPEWKCPGCGVTYYQFDQFHFQTCPNKGKLQAKCQKCGEAESKCSC